MKPIRFLGESLKRLREFPEEARQDAGYQFDKVQPDDSKSMPSIGKASRRFASGTTRERSPVIYTARVKAAVVVLYAFQKKTTSMWRAQDRRN